MKQNNNETIMITIMIEVIPVVTINISLVIETSFALNIPYLFV